MGRGWVSIFWRNSPSGIILKIPSWLCEESVQSCQQEGKLAALIDLSFTMSDLVYLPGRPFGEINNLSSGPGRGGCRPPHPRGPRGAAPPRTPLFENGGVGSAAPPQSGGVRRAADPCGGPLITFFKPSKRQPRIGYIYIYICIHVLACQVTLNRICDWLRMRVRIKQKQTWITRKSHNINNPQTKTTQITKTPEEWIRKIIWTEI